MSKLPTADTRSASSDYFKNVPRHPKITTNFRHITNAKNSLKPISDNCHADTPTHSLTHLPTHSLTHPSIQTLTNTQAHIMPRTLLSIGLDACNTNEQ